MSHSATARLDWIDELRGVACIAVLLHHASYVFSEKIAQTNPWFHKLWFEQIMGHLDFGVLGVFLFFLISGIVIPASVIKTDVCARVFIIHRVLRIYPLYFASVIFAAAIWSQDVFDIISNATMFPRVFGRVESIGVYWSLQIEVLFYIIIALLIKFKWIKHVRLPFYFMLLASVMTASLAVIRYYVPALPVSPALGLVSIAAGYCYFSTKIIDKNNSHTSPNLVMILCAFMTLYLAYYARGSRYSDSISYTFSIALAFALIFCYPLLRLHMHVLVRKGFGWSGTISYSIYLIHQPMLELGNRAFWWGLSYEIALLGILVLIYTAAYISYRTFEVPFIRLYQDLSAR